MATESIAPSPSFHQRTRLDAQARELAEAQMIGRRIHLADRHLKRVADRDFSELTPAEQQAYIGRGIVALRLLDPVKLAVSREDAAIAVHRAHHLHPTSARAVSQVAIATFITSLSGQKGGR